MPDGWKGLYHGQVASYAPIVLPALFLVALATGRWRASAGVEPYAARFVGLWAVVFAIASIVDPIATRLSDRLLIPFVLVGDYRVFTLALAAMQPGRSRVAALLEAAAWTLVVPVATLALLSGFGALRGAQPPETAWWMTYETAFAALAVWWIVRVVPARVGIERARVRRWLRATLAFVVAYYVLWLGSDALVVSGREWGWGLRLVPNVLYYGAFVPFAWATFFADRSAATSTSVQASR